MRSLAATILTAASLTATLSVLTVASAACQRAPAPTVNAADQNVDLRGTWKNERGSELRVDDVKNGVITGQYRSAVGRVDPQQWFPVTGFVHGDVVGFSVDFSTAGSVASWAGQLMDQQLITQWHLSHDIPDSEEHDKIWSSIMSGQDTFVRE